MVIEKFNVVSYIKPTNNFEMFVDTLTNIQKSKYLNKFYISFSKKLSTNFIKELNKYENIIWNDNVDNYWAQEIKSTIENNPLNYYYLWEEDSYIFDIKEFDKSFEALVKEKFECLITQDLKWIKRAEHLLSNNLAIEKNGFIYFNWGTYYAKYCRETSFDSLINGAYPVTISGIYSKNLILKLLYDLTNSNYWNQIISGNFDHYHKNPKLPHSFEVYPGFWWEGKNEGYGNIEYSTLVSKTQYAEELGNRLIDKN